MRNSAPAGKWEPWKFAFATGIECSYPIIADGMGGSRRMDQLEKTFHYRHWKEDLALVRELDLYYLRYGPPYHRVHLGPGKYDWDFTDAVFHEIRRLGIIPIVDLCHFGVPEWIGDFQNTDWPRLFSEYAAAFAARFPWVHFYTPVNEIYVCAKLSALNGVWNERKKSDHAFVSAIHHLCKANLLAIREILKVSPQSCFIQSESAEYFHLGSLDPATVQRAKFENERRFLSLDLLYSVPPSVEIGLYLLDNGMTRDDLRWFMNHGLGDRIIMGNDFYERNEQIIVAGGAAKPAGEVFGWSIIARQYYDRYHRPIMHSETNTLNADEATAWLWKEFFNVSYLRGQGVPVLGFTWYSLIDQIDWDNALTQDLGVVNPVGLYDLARQPRPVAGAYKELVREFQNEPLLPNNSTLAFRWP